ncbi:hypothetical protein EH240_10180 [Mesorhizobium tamadayense]|uniref:DUF6968 domain-containing protein n=1 Tax=Mesorhizobium tamadayense TaxID=425306 RepID=A0A3P3FY95_9HYPH|nr:hypothetical protein [Mesorhizobium tamadayense]RRI03524.1 hypothetical protein EH240_10180 [Mesorhizobium tamadayense]
MAVSFVQRTFSVDGAEVTCRFFLPEPEQGGHFQCRYEIAWPEGSRFRKAYAVDEVQALLLAMQMAHAELLSERENNGRQVLWLDQRSLGLPIANSIRDLDPGSSF